MRKYPTGARWYVISGGEMTERLKTTSPKGIKELFFDSRFRHGRDCYVVVQPRGKIRWYLFHRQDLEEPRLITSGLNYQALTMGAILKG